MNMRSFQNNRVTSPLATDLVRIIKGMYRLVNLISESGSNGNGERFEMRCLYELNLYICS